MGFCDQLTAVKVKVNLSQIWQIQDGYDELAIHHLETLILYLQLSPSPPGFVYYRLKT